MVDQLSLPVILATTIPPVVLVALVVAAVLCCRSRRWKSRLFNRGITPIDDDEIESWKTGRAGEKAPGPKPQPLTRLRPRPRPMSWHSKPRHSRPAIYRPATASVRKSASVIVYQSPARYGFRVSEDLPASPPLAHHGLHGQGQAYYAYGKRSVEAPPTPVLARAPNARPGLTDEAVQGEAAFVSQMKRQPSRLAKPPPASPYCRRSKSTRAGAGRDAYLSHNQQAEYSQRPSVDMLFPTSPVPYNVSSSLSTPLRTSFDDDLYLGGLSPRPLVHQSEIGRAIG